MQTFLVFQQPYRRAALYNQQCFTNALGLKISQTSTSLTPDLNSNLFDAPGSAVLGRVASLRFLGTAARRCHEATFTFIPHLSSPFHAPSPHLASQFQAPSPRQPISGSLPSPRHPISVSLPSPLIAHMITHSSLS